MKNDSNLGGLFPDNLGQLGCSNCSSIFHFEAQCPQTKEKEPKFKFRTRSDMGLKSNALPFKFQVDIDVDKDDDIEISRKHALLRLNSSKVYNLMGLSVKAHEHQRMTLDWMVRMADELDIDDQQMQEERALLLPMIEVMQKNLQKLQSIRSTRIKQAEEMEEMASNVRQQSRKVRARIAKKEVVDARDFWVLRLPDTNVDLPVYADEERLPTELLKDVADAIMQREKQKLLSAEPDEES